MRRDALRVRDHLGVRGGGRGGAPALKGLMADDGRGCVRGVWLGWRCSRSGSGAGDGVERVDPS